MKLREFIKKLQKYQKSHGDLDVELDQVRILKESMTFYCDRDNPFIGD